MTCDPRPVSERAIHKAVCDALSLLARRGVVWFHVANERPTTAREGATLKRMGVRAGVADFVVVLPGSLGPHIGFMELKSKTGRLSAEQKLFRDDVTRLGCLYALPRTVDQALHALQMWGAIRSTDRSAA